MEKLTKLQIIEETADFYSKNPRAVSFQGSCYYYTADGRSCAVGRCTIDPYNFQAFVNSTILGDTYIYNIFKDSESLDVNLKEQYRGHEISFWTDLQNLHDNYENWNESGLSSRGKEQIKMLKRTYA